MVRLTPRAEILNRKAPAGDFGRFWGGDATETGALAAGAGKSFRGSPEKGGGGLLDTELQMLGIAVDMVDGRGFF